MLLLLVLFTITMMIDDTAASSESDDVSKTATFFDNAFDVSISATSRLFKYDYYDSSFIFWSLLPYIGSVERRVR